MAGNRASGGERAAKRDMAPRRDVPVSCDARIKLACLVVFVIAALHARSALALGMCAAVAIALAAAARMRPREAVRVLRPLWPILVITVGMQVLYLQQGDVLMRIGPVAITVGALAESARMVVSLFAIMLVSVVFMRVTSTEELMRTLRWLLAPLQMLGMRIDAFMLSLSVAFRFVPVLVGEFRQLKRAQEARCTRFDGGVRQRLAAYMRLFAPLLRSSYRRADMLAEAFVARCFSCGVRSTTLRASRIGTRDFALLLGTVALFVCVVVL